MMYDDVIMDVVIDPNPATVKTDYKLSVTIAPKVYGILTKDGKVILTKDGRGIRRVLKPIYGILTKAGNSILTKDGVPIERVKLTFAGLMTLNGEYLETMDDKIIKVEEA